MQGTKTWHIVQTKQISCYVQHWKNICILHRTLRNKWKRKDADWPQRKLVMMGVLTQNHITFCSNEEGKYFHADLPIMAKNDKEKVSRNYCSAVLVTSSWNVYKCTWLMVICHHHRLSKEEKTNIQHFYHHILYCQKKTENLKLPITPYRARSCQILEQLLERFQRKSWLAGQVEKISPKQKSFSKTCIKKRVHLIFLSTMVRSAEQEEGRRKAFLWNRQEGHTSLIVNWIVPTDVSLDMSKSFILIWNQKKM